MEQAQHFLTQEFLKRKERNPNFSLRSFAKWLDISPAQLSQMMTGKRPITLNSLKKIGLRVGLSPLEQKNLLTSLLKQKKMLAPDQDKKIIHMQEDQFRVISDWYHFAILSLTQIKGAQSDPRWIARRLGINVDEANQALMRLQRLGIIQLKPTFKQIGEPIQVSSAMPSEAIRKYHKQNLNLAIEKIDTVPVNLREYQSISFPMSPKHVALFKKQIDEFLEQAAELSENTAGSEIYNLNVQLFPITTITE